jgi:hypothetical protein
MSQTWKKVLLTGGVTPTDLGGATGSNGQVLTTNGSSGLSWTSKTVNTDTNTTYSAGTGMSLAGTTFNCDITDTNTNQLTTFNITGGSGGNANIGHGETITIAGGTNCSTARSGNTITINSTDTNTNTNLLSGGTCSGNLNVTGTLTVGGTTTTLNTATLTVDDPIIVVGEGGTADGGITVDHTTASHRGHLIYDGSEDKWIVSKGSSHSVTIDGSVAFTANVATMNIKAGGAPTNGATDACGIGSFWLNSSSGDGTLYVRVGNASGAG